MEPMTYREWLRLSGKTDRVGGYGRSLGGVRRGLRDLWRASHRWVRFPVKIVILGYDQPRLDEGNE